MYAGLTVLTGNAVRNNVLMLMLPLPGCVTTWAIATCRAGIALPASAVLVHSSNGITDLLRECVKVGLSSAHV